MIIRKDYIYIIILWLFHSILNLWYILKDTLPPGWDQSMHLLLSGIYFRGSSLITSSSYYPPGIHLSVAPLYALFGESYDVACLINILFLGILIFSIYGIGKYLYNSEVGLISAAVISFVPMLIYMQRDFLLDFALISVVSLSIYFLLKTNNFNSTKYCIFFGITMGYAVLIKWTAVFFLIAPLCWVFWNAVKEPAKCDYCNRIITTKKIIATGFHRFCSEGHLKKFITQEKFLLTKEHNFFFIALTCLITAGWWYLPNISVFSTILSGSQYWGSIEGDPTGIMGFWYVINSVNIQAYLFLSVLMLIGLIYFFIKTSPFLYDGIKKHKNIKYLFAASIILPFIVFALNSNKDPRYSLPILIFLALMVGFTVSNISKKKIKVAVIGCILIFGVMQTSTITFGQPSFDISPSIYSGPNFPKDENWRTDEIIDSMIKTDVNTPFRVLMLYNHYHANWLTFKYHGFIKDIPLYVDGYEYILANPEMLNKYNFVIYVEDETVPTTEQKKMIRAANEMFKAHIHEFEKVDSFILPNKKEIILYEHK